MKNPKEQKQSAPANPMRRKTMKTLAVGVGALAGSSVLPDKWVKPVIQGIVLPAHAQTSAAQLAFSDGRVDLELVSGHSGTSSMTVRATGAITPAQGGVTFDLTLSGYGEPVVTDTEQNSEPGFFAAVSDALVPAAHAAPEPKCSITLSVTTESDGSFSVEFTLTCGPGIVQVELTATGSTGITFRCGWLDIHACNPCEQDEPDDEPDEITCEDVIILESNVQGVVWLVGGTTVTKVTASDIGSPQVVKNTTEDPVSVEVVDIHCDGSQYNFGAGVIQPNESFTLFSPIYESEVMDAKSHTIEPSDTTDAFKVQSLGHS
ncbi:hypothetical protein [Candidatus Electrothrix sp.]|uniref:hypothetical protein n=1 Tax=Candidatus Electrothrix sp. TaxID=2170559 RepID=UPI0040574C51